MYCSTSFFKYLSINITFLDQRVGNCEILSFDAGWYEAIEVEEMFDGLRVGGFV